MKFCTTLLMGTFITLIKFPLKKKKNSYLLVNLYNNSSMGTYSRKRR